MNQRNSNVSYLKYYLILTITFLFLALFVPPLSLADGTGTEPPVNSPALSDSTSTVIDTTLTPDATNSTTQESSSFSFSEWLSSAIRVIGSIVL